MPAPAIRCVKEGCDKWAVSGSRYCTDRMFHPISVLNCTALSVRANTSVNFKTSDLALLQSFDSQLLHRGEMELRAAGC